MEKLFDRMSFSLILDERSDVLRFDPDFVEQEGNACGDVLVRHLDGLERECMRDLEDALEELEDVPEH